MKVLNNASTSHQEDDDDTHSMDSFDSSWEEVVMDAYKRARSIYEKVVETEGKGPYQNSITRKRRYQLDPHDEEATPVEFNLQKCLDSKKKIQSVLLEEIVPLPPMIYWTLTEMNIKAEDELTLSHVPYIMGDADMKAFGEELMEAFPDGVHGTKVGCGKYINDYILYYTVKYCQEAAVQIPTDKLYRQIYELFPNKIQKNELCEIYPDLKARFEPHLVDSILHFDDKGFQRDNVTPQSLLHSYEVLQCQKCALYDCPHHINNIDRPKPKHTVEDPFATPPNPCGTECYLNRKGKCVVCGASNALSQASPSAKRRSNGQLVVDVQSRRNSSFPVTWTPQEESMMGLLRSVGIQDYCIIARTLLQEPGTNYKKTCIDVYQYFSRQGPLSPEVNVLREMPIKKRRNDLIHRQFRSNKWHGDGKVQNQHAYVPCSHEGPCDEKCECFRRDKICTKYCGCYEDGCKLQFPGCRCSAGNCRTKQCPCYFASWECDPQTCQNCHCAPEDERDDPNYLKCKNVCFQRGLQKKLSARPSQVAGWGCFAEELINKNEFISEYSGEIVSHEESERRARISDKYGVSYLFRLNNEQHVDATRKGNIIRFANHSNNPNCYAKVVVANTEHRIGIFANRQIQAGEELFFNYSYSTEHQLNFLNRELNRKKKVVVVKKEKKRTSKAK